MRVFLFKIDETTTCNAETAGCAFRGPQRMQVREAHLGETILHVPPALRVRFLFCILACSKHRCRLVEGVGNVVHEDVRY